MMAEGRLDVSKASLAQIAKLVHELARAGGAVGFRDHAREEMKKDDLTEVDVLTVLKGCAVVERQGERKFRAEGSTESGERVTVILVLFRDRTGLLVWTVWKIVKGAKR